MNVGTEKGGEGNESWAEPPNCFEPCSYKQYEYELSSSDYPTKKYWETYLKSLVRQKPFILAQYAHIGRNHRSAVDLISENW